MSGNLKSEINDLLEQIFIFGSDLKTRIKNKSESMPDEKLILLKNSLAETLVFQKKKIIEKISIDPEFADKFMSLEKNYGKKAAELYESSLRAADKEKIDFILSKINDL
ncbi:MAG: hypothetical protein PHY40_03835 [Patescibacteria group bacterium]|nr:hypothetical protein [Patescibacteria group bacterium]